jgi:iron complex outermembrane receptor protein
VGALATSTIQNAASAKTYGAELETTFIPARGLTITAALAYLEAEYDKFRIGTTCPAGAITNPVPAGCSVYDNSQMPHAPKWSGNLGINYAFDLGPGEAVAALHYAHTGRSWSAYTHFPVENIVAIDLIDANLSWSPADGRWTIALWARNLTDEKYVVVGRRVAPLFSDGQYGNPREVGVDLLFKF